MAASPQEHQRAIDGAGDENVPPGEAPEIARDQGRREGAEVDHPVVDAEAEARALLVGAPGDGACDDGLEEARAGGHEQEGGEDDPVARHLARDEVARRQQGEGHQEHPPIAVAVGQSAAEDRDHIGHGVDHALEEPHLVLAEAEASADAVGQIPREQGVQPVVGAPLEELHHVGEPEGPREAPDEASLALFFV